MSQLGNKRSQWEKNTSSHFIGWYFRAACTCGNRCLHEYAFTCAPAVKSSQDFRGLIEPQRDSVMDRRWDVHWPVTSTSPPPASTPRTFLSRSLSVGSALPLSDNHGPVFIPALLFIITACHLPPIPTSTRLLQQQQPSVHPACMKTLDSVSWSPSKTFYRSC